MRGPGARARGAEMRDAACSTGVAVAVGRRAHRRGRRARGARARHSTTRDDDRLRRRRAHAGTRRLAHARDLRPPALRRAGAARRGRRLHGDRAAGGGIHSSVRDLRARERGRAVRARACRGSRVSRRTASTTVEVKSGYGLSLEDELKTAARHRAARAELPMRIVPTWLGAHEIPLEYRDDARRRAPSYVEMLIDEMLPLVVTRAARDASPTSSASRASSRSTRRATILTAAAPPGLSSSSTPTSSSLRRRRARGGARRDVGRSSRRGLRRGHRRARRVGTVATLLPGTMLFLGKEHAGAGARADRRRRGRRARDRLQSRYVAHAQLSASSSRSASASCDMSVAEVDHCGDGERRGGARTGRSDGQLAPGFSADLALLDVEDIREMPYWYGDRRCMRTWVRGKACHSQ